MRKTTQKRNIERQMRIIFDDYISILNRYIRFWDDYDTILID